MRLKPPDAAILATITLGLCFLTAGTASAQKAEFLFSFGNFGTSNGESKTPFGLATDDIGNVYVADRDNHRVQVFDSVYVAERANNRVSVWQIVPEPCSLALAAFASEASCAPSQTAFHAYFSIDP